MHFPDDNKRTWQTSASDISEPAEFAVGDEEGHHPEISTHSLPPHESGSQSHAQGWGDYTWDPASTTREEGEVSENQEARNDNHDDWKVEPAPTTLVGEENSQENTYNGDDAWNTEATPILLIERDEFQEPSNNEDSDDQKSTDSWDQQGYPAEKEIIPSAEEVIEPSSPGLNEDALIDKTNNLPFASPANAGDETQPVDSWSKLSIKNVVKEIIKLPFFSANEDKDGVDSHSIDSQKEYAEEAKEVHGIRAKTPEEDEFDEKLRRISSWVGDEGATQSVFIHPLAERIEEQDQEVTLWGNDKKDEDEQTGGTIDKEPSGTGSHGRGYVDLESTSWKTLSEHKKLEKEISEPILSEDDGGTQLANDLHPTELSKDGHEEESGEKGFLSTGEDSDNPNVTSDTLSSIPRDHVPAVDSQASIVVEKDQTKTEPKASLSQSSRLLLDDPDCRLAYRASITKTLTNITRHYSHPEEHPDPRQDIDYWNIVVEDLRKRTSQASRRQRKSPADPSNHVLDSFSQSLLQAAGLKLLIDDEEGSEKKLLQNAAMYRRCAVAMEKMAYGTGHSNPGGVLKETNRMCDEANQLEEMVKYLPAIRENLGDDYIDIFVMYRLFETHPASNPTPLQMLVASEVWREETTEEEKGVLVRETVLKIILPISPDAIYE